MSGYKMPKVSKSGPMGLAKVQIGTKTGKVKVNITYKVDGVERTDDFILDKENCPKWIQAGKSGLYRVKLSGDKTKMFAAVPANEQVVCRFKEFSAEEGQLPAPKKVEGGQYGPYMQMIMILEVVEGPYQGMEVPVFMRYNFIPLEDEDSGKTIAALPAYKTAKHLKLLEDTLYALGVLEFGPLPYKDNMLPTIQKRARKAIDENDTKVLATLQDGYVNAIAPVVGNWDDEEDEGSDDGDEEEEVKETPKAKAPAANAPVSEPDPDDEDDNTDYTKAEDEGDDIDWDA